MIVWGYGRKNEALLLLNAPAEADMPVSASHGFQGSRKYESPIFGVLSPPHMTKKKIARPPDSPDPPPKAFFIKKAKPLGFVLLICKAAFFLFEDRPHDGVQLI